MSGRGAGRASARRYTPKRMRRSVDAAATGASGRASSRDVHRRTRLPRPTTILVGRDEELAQLHRALADVPVAVIYGVPGVGKTTLALAYGETWSRPAVHVPLTAGKSLQHMMYLVRRRLGIGGHCPSLDDEERVDELWRAIDR